MTAALVVSALAVGALAAAATAAPAATGKQQSKLITVGVDEFPPVLNNLTTAGLGEWTAMIAGPALARGYKLLPNFSYQPWIFDKDCTVTEQSPFTVDCTIRTDAKWSDGVPITSNDFKFTYDTIMNKKNDIVVAERLRQDHRVQRDQPDRVPDGVPERLRAVPGAVGGREHHRAAPAHPRGPELQQGLEQLHLRPEDQEADQQRADDGRSRSRPTSRRRWCRTRTTGAGRSRRCRRWCSCPSRDTNSELAAFRSGEVDMIYPQNQIGLRKKIESVDGAAYTTTLGPQWEHFDMLSTVPGLDDLQVRKAIATAMPRQQIVDRVVKDANEKAAVLNNTQYMVNQQSTSRTGTSTRRRATSRRPSAILDAAGWVPGSDGVRQKGNVKLAFTVGTTSGNQARILSEQIIQQQLQKIGVKLTIKNSPDILDVNMPGVRLPDHHLRLGRRPRPVHRQRDLAVVGDPGGVLEAPGQGRRVRLQRAELHQGEGSAGRRAPQRHRPGHRPGGAGAALQRRPTSSSPPTT